MDEEDRQPSKRCLRALEFCAGGIGPFLVVYLAAVSGITSIFSPPEQKTPVNSNHLVLNNA